MIVPPLLADNDIQEGRVDESRQKSATEPLLWYEWKSLSHSYLDASTLIPWVEHSFLYLFQDVVTQHFKEEIDIVGCFS